MDEFQRKLMSNISGIIKAEKAGENKCKCVCSGTIEFGRSSYNNHLHAMCDSCDWRMMQ